MPVSVRNCEPFTGNGKVPTGFWEKPGSGGKKTGRNPTDRGKPGTKRSVLVDEQGGPLAVVIDGANRHDTKLLEATLNAIVLEQPEITEEKAQHLCLDKAYDNPTGYQAAVSKGHTPHIRRVKEEKQSCDASKGHQPRRWVVERTIAWLNKCRAILVRYDKNWQNYLGLVQLACSLIWFRRLWKLKRSTQCEPVDGKPAEF